MAAQWSLAEKWECMFDMEPVVLGTAGQRNDPALESLQVNHWNTRSNVAANNTSIIFFLTKEQQLLFYLRHLKLFSMFRVLSHKNYTGLRLLGDK